MSEDEAQTIAIRALGFLAVDPVRLKAFCNLTGVDASEISGRANENEFLASVLDGFLADESTLLMFTTEADIPPESIYPARLRLSGTHETSI